MIGRSPWQKKMRINEVFDKEQKKNFFFLLSSSLHIFFRYDSANCVIESMKISAEKIFSVRSMNLLSLCRNFSIILRVLKGFLLGVIQGGIFLRSDSIDLLDSSYLSPFRFLHF